MSDELQPHDLALERLRALHPKRIDLSLSRLERLLDALGRPERRLPPVVHVAGTNGKGSTVAVLRAIAEAAGLAVHVFTSPHLVRFAERIRLAGRLIEEEALGDLLERVEEANAGREITFFEITTAAALLAFAETPADLCLLEVGLGGRFDATNVVPPPAVAVITPVDLDHQEFLGGDVRAIAGEKAGIIKPGSRVVLGPQSADARAVLEAEAERAGAPVLRFGRDFDARPSGSGVRFRFLGRAFDLPRPALPGEHQIANAATAAAAALSLSGPRLEEAALRTGFLEASWPARLQRLRLGPYGRRAEACGAELWLDGGHNPHAARALRRHLEAAASDGRPTVLIVGLLARKDAGGVFEAFRGLAARLLLPGFAAESAASPEGLRAAAAVAGLESEVCSDVSEALGRALRVPGTAPPRIVVFGSLHLAGEVLGADRETWPT